MTKRQIDTVEQPYPARVQNSVDLLNGMSNVWRLQILEILSLGETSVASLNVHFPLSQSSLSQHLAVLREKKLVSSRKEAQTVYYKLANVDVNKVLVCLREIFP